MDQFVAETLVGALYKDSLSNSHPVPVPVNDPNEISEIFDAISYNKVSALLYINALSGLVLVTLITLLLVSLCYISPYVTLRGLCFVTNLVV